jgi:hypothetical protein
MLLTIILVAWFGIIFIGFILSLVMNRIMATPEYKSPVPPVPTRIYTAKEWRRIVAERNNWTCK